MSDPDDHDAFMGFDFPDFDGTVRRLDPHDLVEQRRRAFDVVDEHGFPDYGVGHLTDVGVQPRFVGAGSLVDLDVDFDDEHHRDAFDAFD